MDDRKLIYHHLDGLVLLYFTRKMGGSIVETRNKIHEHVDMSHLVKSINLLGDYDKKITEVCVLRKFARWFTTQINKVHPEDRVLEDPYPSCNQFIPQWDDMEKITPEVQRKRTPRHVKKALDQCYSCAKRSKSQAIRELFTQTLTRVAAESGKHLWEELVQEIIIDPTLATYPKVTRLDPAATEP